MKKYTVLLQVLWLLFCSDILLSQTIPQYINYQGILKDESGVIVPDGDYNITFKLFDAETEGTELWSETKIVSVSGGMLNTQLGSATLLNLPFDAAYWLSITVEPGSELTPRIMLSSVPYSYMTMNVMEGTITASNIGNDQVVKSINSLKDDVVISAGTNVTITPSGNTLTINAAGGSGGDITSVNPGSGLMGGGSSGDVTLSVATEGITEVMLGMNSVTSNKIKDGSIGTPDYGDNSITSAKLIDGTIKPQDLAVQSVTMDKISETGATANKVIQYNGSSVGWDYAPGATIKYTLVLANCATLPVVTSTYQKVLDFGSISKIDASSKLEVTFQGRIWIESVTGTGARFELRVDNAATPNGRARGVVRSSQTGSPGVPVTLTGIFTGYGTGSHTISLWAATSYGTGVNGGIDPGCWASDCVIVKEVK